MNKRKTYYILGLLIFTLLSCNKFQKNNNNTPPATTAAPSVPCPDSSGVISYSIQIVPILNSSCGTSSGGCHSAVSGFGDFTNYAGVKIHLPSMLLHAVLQDQPNIFVPMPLAGSKLSICNIGKIRNWINQGYPNN